MKKITHVSVFLLLLSGCKSIIGETKMTDQTPVYDASSEIAMPVLDACLRNSAEFRSLGDQVQIKTFPGTPRLEFDIGRIEKDVYKQYYMVKLEPHYGVNELSVRRGDADFSELNEKQVITLASDCAAGRRP